MRRRYREEEDVEITKRYEEIFWGESYVIILIVVVVSWVYT